MLTTLSDSGVPLVAPAASFIKSKAVLVVGYVLVGIILMVGGWGLTQWMQKILTGNKLEKTKTALVVTQTNVNTLSGIVNQQQHTVQTVTEMRENDADKLDKLLRDRAVLAKANDNLKQQIVDLETSDDEVRTYLNQRVPSALQCVLDNNCPTTTGAGREGGSAEAPDKPGEALF